VTQGARRLLPRVGDAARRVPRRSGVSLPAGLLHDCIELNRRLLKVPFQDADAHVDTSHNVWEFYGASFAARTSRSPRSSRVSRRPHDREVAFLGSVVPRSRLVGQQEGRVPLRQFRRRARSRRAFLNVRYRSFGRTGSWSPRLARCLGHRGRAQRRGIVRPGRRCPVAAGAAPRLRARRHALRHLRPVRVRPQRGADRHRVPRQRPREGRDRLQGGIRERSGDQDFSPARLRRCLEASLRRLQTDYIDVYQLHNPRSSRWSQNIPRSSSCSGCSAKA